MNYAKYDPAKQTVMAWEGTGFNDPAFDARVISFDEYRAYAEADTNYGALPKYDDPGMPWGPVPVEHKVNQQLLEDMQTPTGALIRALDKALPDIDITAIYHQALRDLHTPPAWDAATDYTVGDIVEHEGLHYMALQDVAHAAPDDVYDADTATGGWMPVTLT